MSYDKMNKDVIPPKEMLKPGQEWAFCKTGWRRSKTLTEEEKQQRNTQLKERAQTGRVSQKVLIEQGKENIAKKQSEQAQEIQELTNSIKQLNEQLNKKNIVQETPPKEILRGQPAQEKPLAEIPPHEQKQEKPVQLPVQETILNPPEQPTPVIQKKYRNPLLNQWLK